MESDGPAAPEGLPAGPHPTLGPDTVSLPSWPGPLLLIGGVMLFLGSAAVVTLDASGQVELGDPTLLLWISIAGGLAFVAGMIYVAVRQLRIRRVLPPERYRGPSVLLLLVLALVVAIAATLPFSADVEALLAGEELSALGAVVLLTSQPVALLLVGWLFVWRTDALAALPSLVGRDPARAALSGLGWGVVAWFGASILAVVVVALFELIGVEATPQAVEQAANQLNPVLVVLSLVVLGPIAEEVFFRGIVFNAWLREAGKRYAYVGSSLLFAISHLSLVQFIPLFALALALAWAYRHTGNLLAAIVMHAAFNSMTVLVLFLDRFGVINLPA